MMQELWYTSIDNIIACVGVKKQEDRNTEEKRRKEKSREMAKASREKRDIIKIG